MKTVVNVENFGQLEYCESFWTGKKSLSVNGSPLEKSSKNTFRLSEGQYITLEGNFIKGSSVTIEGQKIVLTPAVKWYEIVLPVLSFILVLVWGNSQQLYNIFPVVGGGLGGFLGALFGFCNVVIIKGVKNVFLKILISLGMLVATFLVCGAIGYVILSLAAQVQG